jgi:hypothetical protein
MGAPSSFLVSQNPEVRWPPAEGETAGQVPEGDRHNHPGENPAVAVAAPQVMVHVSKQQLRGVAFLLDSPKRILCPICV